LNTRNLIRGVYQPGQGFLRILPDQGRVLLVTVEINP
jgi:hypothetical protein